MGTSNTCFKTQSALHTCATRTQAQAQFSPSSRHNDTHAPGTSTIVSPRSYSIWSKEEVYCKGVAAGEGRGSRQTEFTEIVLHRVMYPKTHSNGFKKKKKKKKKKKMGGLFHNTAGQIQVTCRCTCDQP